MGKKLKASNQIKKTLGNSLPLIPPDTPIEQLERLLREVEKKEASRLRSMQVDEIKLKQHRFTI